MASAVAGGYFVAAWAVAPAGQGVEKSGDQQFGGMSCRLVVVEPGAGYPWVLCMPIPQLGWLLMDSPCRALAYPWPKCAFLLLAVPLVAQWL